MNPFQEYDDEMLEESVEQHVPPEKRRRRKRRERPSRPTVDHLLKIWQILLIAGGGLMFVAFFTPWWAGKFDKDGLRSVSIEDARRLRDAIEKKASWYRDYDMTTSNGSTWLWGWDTGPGITAFIFSFFIIAWGIVLFFVRLLHRWAWIGFFACMVFGLLTFILNLVWYFSAPGKDVSGVLSQSVIAGPYLMMPGTLAVFVGGLLGGIFGLMAFLRK